ncbi:MAG: hypothetical protein ACRD2X_02225, partial [Vicinamibacteraceae bacterium]
KEKRMSRRRGKQATEALPPLLVRVIRAAERQGKSDEAQALAAYAHYALFTIPTEGVLPRDDYELFNGVERLARKHLGLTAARRAFSRTITSIEPLERRDRIDSAATALQAESDAAYFDAGLAFGITLADIGGAW